MITPLCPLRDVLWEAQDGLCWLCGRQMYLQARVNHDRVASLDHVFPKAVFGKSGDIGVTLLAHRKCNVERGCPYPTDDELRELVRVWRRVDRHWLHANIAFLEAAERGARQAAARRQILLAFTGDAA